MIDLETPSIHIVKLCVGADSLEQLLTWEAARGSVAYIHTRNAPKRKAELIRNGSLFWVIKGVILARRRILSIEPNPDSEAPQYLIGLSTQHFATRPQPRRAFQGWRYLKPDDAPCDLESGQGAELPADMIRALKAAGAW